MQSSFMLSRLQHFWVMGSLILVQLPLWLEFPIWVGLLILLLLVWRTWMLLQGKASPSRWLTAAMGAIALVLLWWQFRSPLGLQPMGSLLILAVALKFAESRSKKEILIVLFLGYFITGLQLVVYQGLGNFLYALIAVLVILASQQHLLMDHQQTYGIHRFSTKPLLDASRIILFSVPVMLIIFLVAPRIPSFFVLPASDDKGKTGLSDSLTFGQVSELARSAEPVFRVSFAEEPPAREQQYWRAMTLSDFDGSTWRNTRLQQLPNNPSIVHRMRERVLGKPILTEQKQPIQYDVFMEPSSQRWLFLLGAAERMGGEFWLGRDLTLIRDKPVEQRIKYSVSAYLDYRLDPQQLSASERQRYLALPRNHSPRIRAEASAWVAQGLQDTEIVELLLNRFNKEFIYSLEPGQYGANGVDAFLYDRKIGFCEHFASAMTIFLRASGIPARLVTGYQGGELNPYNNYTIVRQYDAHAWLEYWRQGRGWTRVDPTFAVAPERIQLGASATFQDEDSFRADSRFSLDAVSSFGVLGWLKYRLDSIDYLWIRWVLGYDSDDQNGIFHQFFGNMSPKKIALYGGILILIMLFSYQIWLWLQRPYWRMNSAERELAYVAQALKNMGLPLPPVITPMRLLNLAEIYWPDQREQLGQYFRQLERSLYDEQYSHEPRQLRSQWRALALSKAAINEHHHSKAEC